MSAAHVHEPVDTDPTGGDPWMGGPVAITICRVCGIQLEASPTANRFNDRVRRERAADAARVMLPPVPLPRRPWWGRLRREWPLTDDQQRRRRTLERAVTMSAALAVGLILGHYLVRLL